LVAKTAMPFVRFCSYFTVLCVFASFVEELGVQKELQIS
jgi:hypothetical protein